MKLFRILTVMFCIMFFFSGCSQNNEENNKYTVTYYVEDAIYVEDEIIENEKITLPSIPIKDNYTFIGWYDENDVLFDLDTKINQNIKLYAKFEATKYTINYELDGGVNDDSNPTWYITGNEKYALRKPTKENYDFDGWYLNDNKIIYINTNQIGDMTLTARWEEISHNISYILKDGTLPEDAPTSYYQSQGLSALPIPTKDGYIFDGWYIDNNRVDYILVGTTEDITLTARWYLDLTKLYYTITYNCEDGVLPESYPTTYQYGVGTELPAPTPIKEGYEFDGWYDEQGKKIDKITSSYTRNITLTAQFNKISRPSCKWELNQIGFDGNGMTYEILVDDVTKHDPFNSGYEGSSVDIKKQHQNQVETAYNIVIKYSNYDETASWGTGRIAYINNTYNNNGFGQVYAIEINSSWKQMLVDNDSLAVLYDKKIDEGIFKGLPSISDDPEQSNYVQNDLVNGLTADKQLIYGYLPEIARPNYFIYYNVDLINEYNLEDPAELWMKGEWNISKFDEWVKDAQSKLPDGHYALDIEYAEASIGLTASLGGRMTKQNPPLIYLTQDNVITNFEMLQSYYTGGYYNDRNGLIISEEFSQGKTLLHSGYIDYMKNEEKFNKAKMSFVIGVVPYPTEEGSSGEIITTPNINEAVVTERGEFLTYNGQYIKTIDMTNSTYNAPVTNIDCFAIVNRTTNENGVTNEIAMHILHDLIGGYKTCQEETDDEKYRDYLESKFDREIDIEVIMSCQSSSYFDTIETLSISVGQGTHWGPDGLWQLAYSIVEKGEDPKITLNSVIQKYKQVGISFGDEVGN